MKFNKIVCIDNTKLRDWAIQELQKYSEAEIVNFKDYPETKEEVLNRIGDAEAIFVSWQTQLDEEIIKKCPQLKYIGMCCSLYDDESANVAVNFAREQGITVAGIRDYGDPGVVEFIISELVRLLHGFGDHQWKEMPLELTGRKIGIVGLGLPGNYWQVAFYLLVQICFTSAAQEKQEWEEKGVKYLPLKDLLQTVEIISLHLPKNTKILKSTEFQQFGAGKVLINTSLGLPFEEVAFKKWILEPSNYAIFDGDGKKELSREIQNSTNIITASKSAGWSAETHQRLSEKVIENFNNYISS